MEMKKVLCLITVLFSVSIATYAQKPQIGFRIGSNFSDFIGRDAKKLNLENIWGGHGGIMLTVPVSNAFSAKTEVMYSTKGAASKDDSAQVNLGYLDIPLLGQLNTGAFYLEAGPQLSFLVRDKFKNEAGQANLNTIRDSFRRTNLSYVLGAGLRLSAIGVTLGLRYNGDISTLVENIDDKEFRNSVLQFTTSFSLPSRR
jgi:hypothetical protein